MEVLTVAFSQDGDFYKALMSTERSSLPFPVRAVALRKWTLEANLGPSLSRKSLPVLLHVRFHKPQYHHLVTIESCIRSLRHFLTMYSNVMSTMTA